MSGVPNPKNSLGNAIKLYLFPVLVTILATMIWRDVTEMRADVKMLLAQSNIDKTDIQNIKRDIQILDQAVFNKKIVLLNSDNSHNVNETLSSLYFSKDFKHEDIFDLNKYLSKI